jgi:hypothetical protein
MAHPDENLSFIPAEILHIGSLHVVAGVLCCWLIQLWDGLAAQVPR